MGHGRQVHGQTGSGPIRWEERPWGWFEVLYEDEHTWLKEIIILPGQSLSYQRHAHRDEYWTARTAGARAVTGGLDVPLAPGVVASVKANVPHRLYNPCQEAVSVLEWAVGHPTEADIVRISDNYGR